MSTKISSELNHIPKTEINKFIDVDHIYGETDPENLLKIIRKFVYQPYTFMDMGCGDAKILKYIWENDYECIKLTGYELSLTRYKLAVQNINDNDCIQLKHCDGLADSWQNYDIIYICNTMFSTISNERIVDKWLEHQSPKLMLTLMPLPQIKWHAIIPIKVSWFKKPREICYVYMNKTYERNLEQKY